MMFQVGTPSTNNFLESSPRSLVWEPDGAGLVVFGPSRALHDIVQHPKTMRDRQSLIVDHFESTLSTWCKSISG